MLQYVAERVAVYLQCVAQCIAVCCRVLPCVAVCCRVLPRFAVCYIVLQGVLQYVVVCYSVIQCIASSIIPPCALSSFLLFCRSKFLQHFDGFFVVVLLGLVEGSFVALQYV